jgi:hypothetical protein
MAYISPSAKDNLSDELRRFDSSSITHSNRRAVAKEADEHEAVDVVR